MLRRSPALSKQVIQEMISGISGDQFSSNGGLASEAELAQKYGVSRATIREALGKLEAGGAIVRRHGIGTFVSPLALRHRDALVGWFAEVPSFLDVIRSAGHQADCRLLSITRQPAGSVADDLRIDPLSQLVCCRRAFYAGSAPIIYSINYIPLDLVNPSSRDTLCAEGRCFGSIYDFVREYCWRETVYQEAQVWAVAADEEPARELQCSTGDPLLYSEDTGYSSDVIPLWHGLYWYRSDRVSIGYVGNPKLIVSRG